VENSSSECVALKLDLANNVCNLDQVSEKVNSLDNLIKEDQTEIQKLESKLKKFKILLSGSLESLEKRIVTPIHERLELLGLDIATLKDETAGTADDLKQKINGIESCDLVNITRRLSTIRGKINEIIEKTTEMDIQLKEIHRDKSGNLMLHGLSYKDDETMEDLIKEISNIFRTKLGLGREISLVQAKRLTMTRVEVNGFPPVLMSFEHQHDRDAVMSKMGSLDKQSGVMITEDMSRPERIQWGELRKYMNKLSLKQPTAHFFLKNTKLYIDNRLFVWNIEEGQIQENNVITLPSTNCVQLPKMNIKQRLKY